MVMAKVHNMLDLFSKDDKRILHTDLLLEILDLAKSGIEWSDEYSIKIHEDNSRIYFSIPLRSISKERDLRAYIHGTDSQDILLVANRVILLNTLLNRSLTSLLNEEDEGREYTLTKGNQ